MKHTTLDKLNKLNDTAIIAEIDDNHPCKTRLLELGFCRDCDIKFLRKAPSGDPVAYLIKDTVIALRNEDAVKIKINTNPR